MPDIFSNAALHHPSMVLIWFSPPFRGSSLWDICLTVYHKAGCQQVPEHAPLFCIGKGEETHLFSLFCIGIGLFQNGLNGIFAHVLHYGFRLLCPFTFWISSKWAITVMSSCAAYLKKARMQCSRWFLVEILQLRSVSR